MNQQQIDAGFDPVQAERCPRAHRDQARDPGVWRALNPHLTISGSPTAREPRRARVDAAVVDRAARQIVEDGFLQAPGIAPPEQGGALQGRWTDFVPAGDPACRQWTTVAPHRDTLGPDPRGLARDVPSIPNWGSRSSRFASGPRVAVIVDFQRRDAAAMQPATVEFGAPIPFGDRLAWIRGGLDLADLWDSGA